MKSNSYIRANPYFVVIMADDSKNKIIEIVQDLLSRVGFEGEVKLSESAPVVDEPGNEEKKSFLVVSIESDNDLSMLIGKNGQNLSAFDHIARLLVNRKLSTAAGQPPVNPALENEKSPSQAKSVFFKGGVNFMVDINDYRKSKTNYLVDIARNTAKRVIQTQKAEALLPMSSYERRLVHTELASFKEIQTESIGQDPRRRVVIKPTLPL